VLVRYTNKFAYFLIRGVNSLDLAVVAKPKLQQMSHCALGSSPFIFQTAVQNSRRTLDCLDEKKCDEDAHQLTSGIFPQLKQSKL
jgi:hypothetical protein